MKKGDYIANLFDDIKDNIELDSDIIALLTLLKAMLKCDELRSFEMWKDIIEYYDIQKLMTDIDFSPLFYDYPIDFIKKVGFAYFFDLMKSFSIEKKVLIYTYLFNVYDSHCFLFDYLDFTIQAKNIVDEKCIIQCIIKESKNFPYEIFDQTEFLKKVIFLHLDHQIMPLELLEEFTEIPRSKKEKALLKTLLIDYF